MDKFHLLGSSIDDSPGESLDKIARRLKLHNLPGMRDVVGGRVIEAVAAGGDPAAIELPVPLRQYRDCNFSFSGFKSFVADYSDKEAARQGLSPDQILPQVTGQITVR